MEIGYDRPLYILPFDHRASFEKGLFGFSTPLTAEQTATVAASKQVIYDGLKLALAKYGFDGLIAGIRRDEEPTRAKERVFSPRGLEGGWDVRDQPLELWDQFNAAPPPDSTIP